MKKPMAKIRILYILFFLFSLVSIKATEKQDYKFYHLQVLKAETFIASEKYKKALQIYETLFVEFDFVFLKEYQIATQLTLHLNNLPKAKELIQNAMLAGWKMKSIKKNTYLKKLRKDEEWKSIKKSYKNLNNQYKAKLNWELRKDVKKMFSKDQWRAIGALFKFSSKAQDRYAEKKFAPNSELQMAQLAEILNEYGYPGEQLIGNDYYASTILSHHNSISQEYVQKGALYIDIKEELKNCVKNGQMSPFEYAFVEEWYFLY